MQMEYSRPFSDGPEVRSIWNRIPKTVFVETDGPGVRKFKWNTQDRFCGNGWTGVWTCLKRNTQTIFVDGLGHGPESEYGRMPKTVFVDTDGPGVRTWSKRNTQGHFCNRTMTLTSDRIWLNTQDRFLNNLS